MKLKMTFIPFIVVFLIFLSFSAASAAEKIDNEKIQTFRGVKGRWIHSDGKDKLKYYISVYGADYSDIVNLNGQNYARNSSIFIPFSEKYIMYLKEKGCSMEEDNGEQFLWPIRNFDRITSAFGDRFRGFHVGIDIPAGKGIPIVAVQSGVVKISKFMEGYGNTVWIEHRKNFTSRYCHASELLVKEGELVRKGQVIALVGSTGNSTGHHLHLEIRCCGVPLNPLDFLPYSSRVKESQYMKTVGK